MRPLYSSLSRELRSSRYDWRPSHLATARISCNALAQATEEQMDLQKNPAKLTSTKIPSYKALPRTRPICPEVSLVPADAM
jgi:hypothetical protein